VRFMGRNLDGLKGRTEQLEALTANRPVADSNALLQIERARALRPLTREKLKLKLRADVQLTAPYSGNEASAALPPLQLQLSAAPAKFNGARERAADLRAQLETLRPQVVAAGSEQSKVLQEIALRELNGQKKLIEKYLVEARFALARIYEDRIGGAP